jgi:hypothetical protein
VRVPGAGGLREEGVRGMKAKNPKMDESDEKRQNRDGGMKSRQLIDWIFV